MTKLWESKEAQCTFYFLFTRLTCISMRNFGYIKSRENKPSFKQNQFEAKKEGCVKIIYNVPPNLTCKFQKDFSQTHETFFFQKDTFPEPVGSSE